jgi:hypothetical protein
MPAEAKALLKLLPVHRLKLRLWLKLFEDRIEFSSSSCRYAGTS